MILDPDPDLDPYYNEIRIRIRVPETFSLKLVDVNACYVALEFLSHVDVFSSVVDRDSINTDPGLGFGFNPMVPMTKVLNKYPSQLRKRSHCFRKKLLVLFIYTSLKDFTAPGETSSCPAFNSVKHENVLLEGSF
jgi:hypothetical protein